jgi:hypothetical protein
MIAAKGSGAEDGYMESPLAHRGLIRAIGFYLFALNYTQTFGVESE